MKLQWQVIGAKVEDTFMLLHKSRREVEVSGEMLAWSDIRDEKLKKQMRADIWNKGGFEPELDKVGKKLSRFRSEMEQLCLPLIDREYGKRRRTQIWPFNQPAEEEPIDQPKS